MCHGFKIALYVHVTLDLIIISMVFPSSSPTNGVSDASGSLMRTWFSLKIGLITQNPLFCYHVPDLKKLKKKTCWWYLPRHFAPIFHAQVLETPLLAGVHRRLVQGVGELRMERGSTHQRCQEQGVTLYLRDVPRWFRSSWFRQPTLLMKHGWLENLRLG